MALPDVLSIEGWGKLRAPLGLIAMCAVGIYGCYDWAIKSFVQVDQFRAYQSSMEMRILEAEQRRLELETLRLQTKRASYPKQFDAVDTAVLARQEALLNETAAEISKLRQEQRQQGR